MQDEIAEAAVKYVEAAEAGLLYTLRPHLSIGDVTADDMRLVYKSGMVRDEGPGREVYDQLMLAAPLGKCPLCDSGHVSTLDHHLPKSSYPALAVVPVNLVPACKDCNTAKLDEHPDVAEQQTLHPYFDDVEHERWLCAVVVEETPAHPRFFVDPPASWDSVMTARVNLHFEKFGLRKTYGVNGAEEMGWIRDSLARLLATEGAEGVQRYLAEQADDRAAKRLNSWQAALYRGLADSEWYCNGGFAEE